MKIPKAFLDALNKEKLTQAKKKAKKTHFRKWWAEHWQDTDVDRAFALEVAEYEMIELMYATFPDDVPGFKNYL